MYDDVLGRWGTQDPLAEKYCGYSPYNFCLNNPVKFVDVDGRDVKVLIKGNTITIQANLILFNKQGKVSKETVNNYRQQIQKAWARDENAQPWTYQNGKKTYDVVFDINVMAGKSNMSNPKNRNYNGINNYVEIIPGNDRLIPVSRTTNSNVGVWRESTQAVGHELGHIMGLDDRYTKNKTDDRAIPDAGYEANIMGIYGGKTEQSNINDLIKNIMKQSDPFSVPSYFERSTYINVKNREIK